MSTQKVETNGAADSGIEDSMVVFETSQGIKTQASLLRFTRFTAVFELYNPAPVFRSSEVLVDFRMFRRGRPIYFGRAVINALIESGTAIVCEATLNEDAWMDLEFPFGTIRADLLADEFKGFLDEWQNLYRVLPEYKVVIADMQSFLSDLQLWLNQIELGVQSMPAGDRAKFGTEIAHKLEPKVVPWINELFHRFETVSAHIDQEVRPAHTLFGRRQIHPLILQSPFVYRTFTKPLGYAGDYEVVNMMFRETCEGSSLFGKMVNAYALQLPPIIAHRNRITYLREKLVQETSKMAHAGRMLRVFNLGCGPAHEVQQFLSQGLFCDHASLVLADFNDETIRHTASTLDELKRRFGHRTQIEVIKKSVNQLLRQYERPVRKETYDLIYCAGLFDYLSDSVCQRLMSVFYDMLEPGGLLIATNVDVHPSRNEMEYFLEWNLIHRSTAQMAFVAPPRANKDNINLLRDPTGVNVFMEVRKAAGEK